MQDPGQETVTKVETGNEVDGCLENPTDNHLSSFIRDMKDLEKSGSVSNDNVVKSCGIGDCSRDDSMRPESDDHETKQNGSPRDESCIGVLHHESDGKLGCSIEEGLEKVSLVGNDVGLVVCANGMKETEIVSVGVQNESDSDSESESESEATTSSSSASSSSSESSDDDDDDDDNVESMELGEKLSKSSEQKVDMEEGEIVGSDTEEMVSRSDDDDDDDSKVGEIDVVFGDGDDDDVSDIPKGPIKSKNELAVLPPVPPVSVTLQPGHQILPVGAVISTLGAQVVVEGSEKHSPLSEGSILWISETRSPLGLVDEIFGPVKSPFYIVRFNTESEVPSGLQVGSLIGFVQEFADHVLNDKNIYQKGYDASGENDEELMDEAEFSDDEKEAEYKKMMKMSKRGNADKEFGKKNRKNFKNRERTWSTSQSPAVGQSQPNQAPQYVRAPVPSTSQGNMAASPLSRPDFPMGPTPFPVQAQPAGPPLSRPSFPTGPTLFPDQAQAAGFMLNSLLANMMQFQQQPSVPMPGSFQMNGVPWFQQNPLAQQMAAIAPLLQQPNLAPPQQQFDLSQLNYAGGPTTGPNVPWSGPLGSNLPNQAPMSLPSGPSQFPMFPGSVSGGPQGGPSGNSQPATTFPMNADARPPFNQGFSSGGGRGRKSFHPRGRGGRFDSRRGRQ